ncbi:glycosyltransferase family 2 protein [Methanobacterium aggregans]|uniref:glycosyltransferase family 2 protein n=1 Tax=Methanobacterium aggregans TaxID=1615586 RepID=UPI001AE878B4|nr:glycosyltransferase family 2 protein [Methanobacterium aggregans]MBP2045056.1 GT2 family glycosyltransferase [Methanobacterium aggregans]
MENFNAILPHVSIIILNWNGWKDTIECLESVYQINYPNYDVVLIDNDSKDDSIEKIKEYCNGALKVESTFFEAEKVKTPIKIIECPLEDLDSKPNTNTKSCDRELVIIRNNENLGFAEGNNVGIIYVLEHLKSDYVMLLNNDTVVDTDFLNELIPFSEKADEIGVVGPSVFYYNDPDTLTYIGGHVDVCHGKITYPHLNETLKSEIPEEMDYISGCSLLIKRDVIEDIGLLDPDYFLYYEDTDWCLRVKNAGYRLFYVPKAKIWHKVSASIVNSSTSFYYGTRNQFLLMKKNCKKGIKFRFIKFLAGRFLSIINYLIKGNVEKFILSHKILVDVLKGNYGYKKL